MSEPPDRGLPPEPEYLAAVEARLSELARAPLVLSTRDWQRVRRWRERSIPLEVVLRALGDVLGRPSPEGAEEPRRPYPLAYCERAVEQRWKAAREGTVGRSAPAGPPAPRVRAVVRALAREVQAAAARARSAGGARRALAPPLREAARRLREAARGITPEGSALDQIAPRLVGAEEALRAGWRAALGAEWERMCAEEERRLGKGLARMTGEAARATVEAAALRRLRSDLGVPTIDPGALHARLHRPAPRRRLTRQPESA